MPSRSMVDDLLMRAPAAASDPHALDELAAAIADGSVLAMPPDYSGVAMAATRALVRRGPKDLQIVALPTAGLAADLLIGIEEGVI